MTPWLRLHRLAGLWAKSIHRHGWPAVWAMLRAIGRAFARAPAAALLTLAVGLLALGGEPVAPLLASWPVLVAGGVTLGALLLALIAALDVVLPAAYRYRAASLDDRRTAYQQMLERKGDGLRAAVVFFGIAMLGLAALIGLLMWARVG